MVKICLQPDSSLTEENQNGKETAGHISLEDRDTFIGIEGEHGTEAKETGRQLMDGKEIGPGTHMLATHRCKENPDSPVGEEVDLSLSLRNEARRHRALWLADDGKG